MTRLGQARRLIVGVLIVLLGSMITILLVASTSPDRSVTTFGAIPDDGRDDTAALRRAMDELHQGATLTFEPGVYQHSDVLTIRVPGVTLAASGAHLEALDETRSAVRIDADDVTVRDLSLGVAATTRRFEAPEQHKVWISGHRGVVLSGVTITGSAAAGIFVDGASRFRIERPRVSDTRADGIHITGGAHDGLVDHPIVARTGDDGIAVVSYDRDPAPCRSITVDTPRVLGTTWGRGLSVVGGRNITYRNVHVQDSNAAALYVAVEGDPYFTTAVEDVTISGGRLLRANHNSSIDHGAIMIYAGRSYVPLRRVAIQDIAIEDTRPSAGHQVGVVAPDGAHPEDLRFDRLRFGGGPATRYGGNVPPEAYLRGP